MERPQKPALPKSLRQPLENPQGPAIHCTWDPSALLGAHQVLIMTTGAPEQDRNGHAMPCSGCATSRKVILNRLIERGCPHSGVSNCPPCSSLAPLAATAGRFRPLLWPYGRIDDRSTPRSLQPCQLIPCPPCIAASLDPSPKFFFFPRTCRSDPYGSRPRTTYGWHYARELLYQPCRLHSVNSLASPPHHYSLEKRQRKRPRQFAIRKKLLVTGGTMSLTINGKQRTPPADFDMATRGCYTPILGNVVVVVPRHFSQTSVARCLQTRLKTIRYPSGERRGTEKKIDRGIGLLNVPLCLLSK